MCSFRVVRHASKSCKAWRAPCEAHLQSRLACVLQVDTDTDMQGILQQLHEEEWAVKLPAGQPSTAADALGSAVSLLHELAHELMDISMACPEDPTLLVLASRWEMCSPRDLDETQLQWADYWLLGQSVSALAC